MKVITMTYITPAAITAGANQRAVIGREIAYSNWIISAQKWPTEGLHDSLYCASE